MFNHIMLHQVDIIISNRQQLYTTVNNKGISNDQNYLHIK